MRTEDRGQHRTGDGSSRWPSWVQYLFVAFLTLLFFSLALSMARHHFLRGSHWEQSPVTSR